MPLDRTVKIGDCISSIAYEHGFFWETIWNDPQNGQLKAKRQDPNILQDGDVVHVPDLRIREEPRATNQRHSFTLKGVPAMLRLRIIEESKLVQQILSGRQSASEGGQRSFLDKVVDTVQQAMGVNNDGGSTAEFQEPEPEPVSFESRPRKNVPYLLDIDGRLTTGNSDSDGRIELSIPPNATSGTLTLDPGTVKQQVIPLNLGHLDPVESDNGVVQRLKHLGFPCQDGPDDTSLAATLKAFQEKRGLLATGQADQATRNKLQELHGS